MKALLLVVFLIAGCGYLPKSSPGSIRVTNKDGVSVQVQTPTPPDRAATVSVSPSGEITASTGNAGSGGAGAGAALLRPAVYGGIALVVLGGLAIGLGKQVRAGIALIASGAILVALAYFLAAYGAMLLVAAGAIASGYLIATLRGRLREALANKELVQTVEVLKPQVDWKQAEPQVEALQSKATKKIVKKNRTTK